MLNDEVDYRQDITELRHNIFENLLNKEFTADYRWQEMEPEDRLSKPLFEVLTRENQRARVIANSIDGGECQRAKDQASELHSPMNSVNRILRQSGLKISVSVGSNGKLLAHNQENASYDLAHASDGERNAVVTAATVLTAPEGAAILIDEPDRHLHRSVIVPFISALVDQRSDCTFVVATYETALPNTHRNARALVVRSCAWQDGKPAGWDLDEIQSGQSLSEEVRAALLGARTKTILVEGSDSSLDSRLYSILFQGADIKGIGGHAEVENAVSALRNSSEYTSIEVFGIVDGDGRPTSSAAEGNATGVYLLDAYCVECLYYCESALAAVARHQAPIIKREPDELVRQLKQEILARLSSEGVETQMAARRGWNRIRAEIRKQTPSRDSIIDMDDTHFSIEVESPYQSERQCYQQLLEDGDFDGLAKRYPIYKSNALDPVAQVLRLADRKAYVDTLLHLIRNDDSLAEQIRARMGTWAERLAKDTAGQPR